MTPGGREAERLLSRMAERRPPAESEPRRSEQRARIVARLERFHDGIMQEREHRRRRPWSRVLLAATLAASVAIALGALVARGPAVAPAARVETTVPPYARLVSSQGTVELLRPGQGSRREQGHRLRPKDELRTRAESSADVALAQGTRIEMDASTHVQLLMPGAPADRSDAVRITRGRIVVSVPKLAPGASFSVETPAERVVVFGTRFSVLVPEAGPTLVEVEEGKVLVEHATGSMFLTAGSVWSASAPFSLRNSVERSEEPAPEVEERVPNAASRLPRMRPARTSPSEAAVVQGHDQASAPDSSLAEQNALLMGALRARRGGDDGAALSQLDALLGKYPKSPVSEEAEVERFRALKRIGRKAEAARAARHYLTRHPSGFAAEEARSLALGAPAEAANTGDGS